MYRSSSTQMLKFRHLAKYFAPVLCAEECSQPSRTFQKHVQVAPCGSELLIYLKMGLQGGHIYIYIYIYIYVDYILCVIFRYITVNSFV